MKKKISNLYNWGTDGKDYYVDEALKKHFERIENVGVTGPMSGSRENVYHLTDYGVTLKHLHSGQEVSITLYGADGYIQRAAEIVMIAVAEGLSEHQKKRRLEDLFIND